MAAQIYLSALTLAQFRSHALSALALDGRPVALSGPNGAGKTNVLEAVSMLSPGRGLRGAKAEDLARAGGPGGWRVTAALQRHGEARELRVESGPDGRRRVLIDGKQENQLALGALVPMLWLTPAMDRLWIEGPDGRRRFLDRAALSFTPAHARAALDYEKVMRERTRLLKDGVTDDAWLGALEARMAEAGLRLATGRAVAASRLSMAQMHAKSLFPKAEIAIVGDMENAVAATLRSEPVADPAPTPEQLDIADEFRVRLAHGRRADAAAGRALDGPHRSDLAAWHAAKGVEARLASTGEQKALLVSLVLANARALRERDGAAPLLLLDEVAAHLDAARRAALFDEVSGLDAQAFMTGAGPELFDDLGDRGARFSACEHADGTQIAAR